MHDREINAATEAFAVPGEECLIDMRSPTTGLSCVYGETLEQIQVRYPGACIVVFETWRMAKAQRQRTPIEWAECSKERYWEMLEVLPPAAWRSGVFLVGEPTDSDAGNGRPRFDGYRQWGSTYYASSRPMTIQEFQAEIARRAE